MSNPFPAPEAGGPAFPVSHDLGSSGGGRVTHIGMTLRDHFASQVITGLLCSGDYSMSTWDQIASTAYDVADAMLKAREAKP